MSDPHQELQKVRLELEQTEQEIQILLEKQNKLIQKKSQLEQLVRSDAQNDNSKDWGKTGFSWSKKLEEVCNSKFGISAFRPLQLQTMNATMSGKDCILIMPTGGGKSLCFQLPGLVVKGITLVVSPLISLMEDQVMSLERNNITAVLLNASSSKEQVKYVHDNMTNPKCPFKMLYVTPEKLAKSKRFMAKVEKMYEAGLLARLVIDEVHCCSQWGHDFRPDYKFLGVMRRQFPGVPILGLTATASSSVLQDVKKILGIDGCLVFRASFNRTNLFYEVLPKPSGMKKTMDEIQKLISSRFKNQSGIIYCLTRKDTEEVTRELQSRGIQAGSYHAYLDPKYRSQVHTQWIADQIQVVVATIAFGMGIDKPDVRFVIHHSISKSMENYYQESGRAGRDDRKAHCILYAGFTDMARQSTMVFTEQTGLEKLYGMIQYAYDMGRCRRTLIAHNFGERWNATQCDEMCDQCNPRPGTGDSFMKDVTSLCKDIISIMENAKQKDQRITALKLMESTMGRGAAILRVSSVKPCKMTQHNVERVLVYMILNGYLREDFHFTAYTTISYLLAGPKSNVLMSANHKVQVSLETKAENSKKSAMTATITSRSDSTPQATSVKKRSTKPVFINKEKSHFIPGGTGVQSNSGDSELNGFKTSKFKSKKRNIIDSDDDELDFGDIGEHIKSKKKKMVNGGKCIVIDSDEDLDSENITEDVEDCL